MSTLKVLLATKKVRQRALSRELGVADEVVSRWANQASPIPARYIEPIARFLDCDVREVLAVADKAGGS